MNSLSKKTVLTATLACAAAVAVNSPSYAAKLGDPLRFWEGRTESVGIIKLIMKKPYKSRSFGRGKIRDDGSLDLVQRVEDEGKPPKERRWHIREVGPGRYTGTMSEANGPVAIEEVGGRYRFRFKMDGGVSVEQWIIPDADGKSGTNKVTIKKYGMTVGRSDGSVRKVD